MSFLRQLDILDPKLIKYSITIIGIGGIGSPTALVLAKMGCNEITLIDADAVEEHNPPNQLLYQESDIGRLKVTAAGDILGRLTQVNAIMVPERFNGTQRLEGIVVSGVDSMQSRQTIWESVKFNPMVPFYLDGRTGGEVLQVFSIRPCNPDDIEFYEQNLFPDKDAARLPCTGQSIIYTAAVIAGLIAGQIKKWLKQEPYYRKIVFDLKTITLLTE